MGISRPRVAISHASCTFFSPAPRRAYEKIGNTRYTPMSASKYQRVTPTLFGANSTARISSPVGRGVCLNQLRAKRYT